MKKIPLLAIITLLALAACSNERQQSVAETDPPSKPSKILEAPTSSTAVIEHTPAVSEADSKLAAIIEQAISATSEADVVAVEEAIASIEDAGMLDLLGAALEKRMSERTSAGAKAAPGLQLALSAVYGRKGMAGKAYAAILAAEKTAAEPGVSFNLAVIHGRKALLAPSSKNDSFSLVIGCDIPNATVTIDGIEQGQPPLRLEALREGTHEVGIHARGYEAYQQTVKGSGGETIELKAKLIAIPVSVSIFSQPPGTTLFLDGNIVGQTSWEGTLPPGVHSIKASYPGHQSMTKTIEVVLGSIIDPIELSLQALPSYINVTTSIPNVEIYIDGILKGIAPLRLETPKGNPVRLRVAPIDWWYEAQQRTVTIPAGEERSEHFELVHGKATANFIADMNVPRGARVFINGELRGTVPFSIPDFPLGVYELRIEASGYEPYRLKWGFTGTQLAITPMKKK